MGAKKGKNVPTATAIHPNSRKAGQAIKRLAHGNRVLVTKKIRERKDALLRKQVEWFKDAVAKWNRPLCLHEFDILIEKYIIRNQEEMLRLEDSSAKEAFKAAEMKRIMVEEEEKYSASGLLVPDLISAKGFNAVKHWALDVKELVKIPVQRYRRSQLFSAGVSSSCQSAFECPALLAAKEAIEIDDVETK